MNIKINNYKNLQNLNLDICENKINYIFGISGSGKSSIGDALKKENIEQNVSIGFTLEEVEILVNNSKIEKPLVVFNTSSVEKLLINNTNNNMVYNIVFDNSNKMIELRKEFDKQLSELIKYKEGISDYISKIDKMNKIFGGKVTQTNDLPKSAKIIKIKNAVSETENKNTIKIIKEKGNWFIPWIKKGYDTEEYKKSICPFCGQSLNDSIKEEINKILDFNEKDFEVMFQDESILTDLNIKIPDYSNTEEINVAKDEIIKKVLLKEELLGLINIMNYYNNPLFNPSMLIPIKLSNLLVETFPNLKEIAININNSLGEIKSTLGNLKRETDKVITHNIRKINSYLDKFGINYNFDIDSYSNENNTLSYSLFHKLDENKENRIHGLSFGEKNLISLLLFLLSSKEEVVIIDDPASSFDDYRRKEILSLIYDICPNKTLLVLSHDHIFIKYALFNYNNSKNQIDDGKDVSELITKYYHNTGKIIALENYESGNINLKDIHYEDFNILSKHILKFLNNDMEYFRKVINLRLFYEFIKSDSSKDIYEYLSSIYHKTPQNEIIAKLTEKGLIEDSIIDKIYHDTNIKLPVVPADEYFKIDINSLTLFEKILYYRDEQETEARESFNNVVHMNESLHVCLNPYYFNYFSPYVYTLLKDK